MCRPDLGQGLVEVRFAVKTTVPFVGPVAGVIQLQHRRFQQRNTDGMGPLLGLVMLELGQGRTHAQNGQDLVYPQGIHCRL